MSDASDDWGVRAAHFGRRINDLLKSMEGQFLDILAEHQAAEKEAEEPPAADDEDRPPAGHEDFHDLMTNKEQGVDEEGRLRLVLYVHRDAAEMYLEDFLRARIGNSTEARLSLLTLAEFVIRLMVRTGHQVGWFKEDIPDDDDEEY